MAQTSWRGASTTISPLIRRELGEVRSMRTATSSHSSPLSVSDWEGVPPNHQTEREVEVGFGGDGDDDMDGLGVSGVEVSED